LSEDKELIKETYQRLKENKYKMQWLEKYQLSEAMLIYLQVVRLEVIVKKITMGEIMANDVKLGGMNVC
jgi:hypothetical protein